MGMGDGGWRVTREALGGSGYRGSGLQTMSQVETTAPGLAKYSFN